MSPRSTTVYLVRHGETAWNASGRCQGTADVPLNENGRSQVRELARQLAHVDFDAAYTSPLMRARETAEAILAALRLRAMPVSERIAAAHPGETVLISAHGHLNRVLALHVLGRPDDEFWLTEQANASALALEVPIVGATR